MGTRGPAPKPLEMRRLEGNPGKRPIPEGVPEGDGGVPDRPAWLSDEAGDFFTEIVEQASKLRVLSSTDGAAVAVLAEALQAYVEIRQTMTVEWCIAGAEGQPKKHPLASSRLEWLRFIANWSREFGFSPSARARVFVTDEPDGTTADQAAEILGF